MSKDYVPTTPARDSSYGFAVKHEGWTLFDTEVVWTIQVQEEPEGGQFLAP
jgi:hypothetical protein